MSEDKIKVVLVGCGDAGKITKIIDNDNKLILVDLNKETDDFIDKCGFNEEVHDEIPLNRKQRRARK